MYYAEELINGQLCYMVKPYGEWHVFSYKQLVEKYLLAQQQLEIIREKVEGTK